MRKCVCIRFFVDLVICVYQVLVIANSYRFCPTVRSVILLDVAFAFAQWRLF